MKDLPNAATQLVSLDASEIKERKRMLNFGADDIARLQQIHSLLEDRRGEFADAFYAHLMQFPPLQKLLADEATIARLKRAQEIYFSGLTAGEYGAEYVANRMRVGIAHQRIGLEPKWYIGAYREYLSLLLPMLWQMFEGDCERYLATVDSLLKIVMFDMGLALDTYFDADKRAISGLRHYAEQIVHHMPSGLLVLDTACNVRMANEALRAMLEIPAGEELAGKPLQAFFPSPLLRQRINELLEGDLSADSIHANLLIEEGSRHFEVILSSAMLEQQVLLMMVQDITGHKEAEERLAHMAQHDFLTGLPNRLLLNDRLIHALAHAKRAGGKVAVIFLDLDRFKVINDTLGHPIGDKLLQEVAGRIRSSLRTSDTVSRQGGDEFVVMLEDIVAANNAATVAAKLLKSVSRKCVIDGNEIEINTSIGISMFPEDGHDSDTLIKHADAAMYHAKESGRNNYQFFTREMNQRVVERMTMEKKLRHALEHNQFLLHYQPQVDLRTGRVFGAEALLRWNDPENGMVPPGQFIPVAEENRLIIPIGEWVLREACRQSKEWRKQGLPPIIMAVNLSAVQFRQKNLGMMVMGILHESGLTPPDLELEITESAVMHNVEEAIALLRQLKAVGLKLAMDDFGTGYSNLNHLKRFPLDKLKIDQSFVRGVPQDLDDVAIVSTIISMAHNLKLKVVDKEAETADQAAVLKVIAEGVETAEQVAFLKQQGCDEMQGYYFSKPVGAEKFADLLASGRML